VIERRQTTRYDFGAIAEVIDLDTREDVIAITRDLSLSGCFVKTRAPFPKGTAVIVRIAFSGADFAATGRVTGNITWEGMGVEFGDVRPEDRAIIEQWLDPKPRHRQEHAILEIPVIVFGQLSTADFSEETEAQITTSDRASLKLAAAVVPGQVVRLKNRLTRHERDCRVISVDRELEANTTKVIGIEFLEPASESFTTKRDTRFPS
jgi:hypothetical protein